MSPNPKPAFSEGFFKVAIEKAVFGSYDLKITGHTGLVKVRRLK